MSYDYESAITAYINGSTIHKASSRQAPSIHQWINHTSVQHRGSGVYLVSPAEKSRRESEMRFQEVGVAAAASHSRRRRRRRRRATDGWGGGGGGALDPFLVSGDDRVREN